MPFTKQKPRGHEVFRVRVSRKRRYVEGWYVEVKIGNHQWLRRPKAGPLPGVRTKTAHNVIHEGD